MTVIRLVFSGTLAEIRGGYFVVRSGEEDLYVANSASNADVPPTFYAPDNTITILDYGVSGPGPDEVTVPRLPPGDFSICTYNASVEGCAPFSVANS
jgi:hypothetical protein